MCIPWLLMTMPRTTGTSEDGVPVLLALIQLQMGSRLEDMLNDTYLGAEYLL